MRQVVCSRRTGEVRLADMPAPACPAGGVVVRTRRSVVSPGTERQVIELARKSLLGKAAARPDLVRQVIGKVRTEGVAATLQKVGARLDEAVALGYSAAGDVVEAGAGADGLRPGDRVAVAGAGYAAHAEFNAVPRNLCARLPPGVSYADGAFATVGAIALQGVRQAEPRIGERVAVIGLGLIGLLTAQILKANGCAVLGVDPDGDRAALARRLGVDAAVAGDGAAACDAFTAGRGADAVVITAATPSNGPVESAAEMARPRGRVVAVGLVGLNVPREPFYRKELDLRLSTSTGPGRYDPTYEEEGRDYPFAHVRFTEQRNLESFLYLVEQRKVTPAALVTHKLAFADALDAYALLDGRPPASSPRPPAAGGELLRRGRVLPAGRLDEGRRPAVDVEPLRRPLGIVLEYPDDVPPHRTVRLEAGPAGPRRIEAGPAGRAGAAAGGDLRVGVFGAGRFARGVLLPRLAGQPGVRLAGVCTRSGGGARDAAERFGAAVATSDPARLLDDPDVDAVVVATRHASHAALAAAALRAGKHVFVEKPLCISEAELDDVERALDEARGAGRAPCLMVGFNRRFSPHARAVRAAFAEREAGGAPMVVTYRVNAGTLLDGSWLADPREGGRLVGEACHFVDFCGALVDAEPLEVTAGGIAPARGGDGAGDTVVVTVRYADRSLATIQYVTVGHPGLPKERCEVSAGGRTAVVDDFRVTRFHGGGRTVRGRQAKGFAEALRAFVDACRGGGPWPIPWRSLAATHRVCFAAARSLRTGRPVAVEPAS